MLPYGNIQFAGLQGGLNVPAREHGMLPTSRLSCEGPQRWFLKSHSIGHIQVADMAAGWAVYLLIFSHGAYVELAKRFAWVGVNEVVVSG